MEADDEKMFLENIEEFVQDEGKIVTYKWLSATLDIHVNTAKQLLYKYAMPNNKQKDDVHMTYLVAGTLLDGSGMKIQIVRENCLDRAKSKLKLVTSEHIYSVQKASNLPDLNLLYGVDNIKIKKIDEDRFGAIRCSKAIQRLENDIKLLRIKALSANAIANNPVTNIKKGSSISVKPSSDNVKSEPVAPVGKTVETEPTKSVESKSNGPSIASLFTAQSKANKNTSNKAGSTAGSNKLAAKKGQGGIAMFFTKQSEKQTANVGHKDTGKVRDLKDVSKHENAEKKLAKEENVEYIVNKQVAESSTHNDNIKSVSSKEKSTNEEDVDLKNKKEKSHMKTDHTEKKEKKIQKVDRNSDDDIIEKKGMKNQKVDTNSDDDSKEKKGKKNQKVDTKSKTTSSGRGKKKKSQENSQPTKKRKRIMVISDDSASSEEDIFGHDSDNEMPPPSPEIMPEEPPKPHSSDDDIVPSTPISQQICNGKMRKRKLVNKTFADKDGFIMTKKEYVFESCSEDDADDNNQTTKDQILATENDKPSKPKPRPSAEMEETVEDVMDKPTKKQSKGEKQTRKKKASPPAGQKSKQSTLMSFFNKK